MRAVLCTIMGIGPVPAMRNLFHRTGLTLADFDLFELNEAFAPQVLAVLRDEPIPMDTLNVNGAWAGVNLENDYASNGGRVDGNEVRDNRGKGLGPRVDIGPHVTNTRREK